MRWNPFAAAIVLLVACPAPKPAGPWGGESIVWRTYAEGLKVAAQEHRPLCVVFVTTWCPHCKAYANVFGDPRVIEQAKHFVMVRVDDDKEPEVAARLAPDGRYIPRTFFLSAQGELDPTLVARPDRFRYFYEENNPDSLLSGMTRATARLQ